MQISQDMSWAVFRPPSVSKHPSPRALSANPQRTPSSETSMPPRIFPGPPPVSPRSPRLRISSSLCSQDATTNAACHGVSLKSIPAMAKRSSHRRARRRRVARCQAECGCCQLGRAVIERGYIPHHATLQRVSIASLLNFSVTSGDRRRPRRRARIR